MGLDPPGLEARFRPGEDGMDAVSVLLQLGQKTMSWFPWGQALATWAVWQGEAEKQLLQLPSLGFSGRLAVLATTVRTTVALLSQQARAGSHEPSPPQPVPVETVADLHRCLLGLPAWAGQGGLKTELLGTVEVARVGSSQLQTLFPTSDSTEGVGGGH